MSDMLPPWGWRGWLLFLSPSLEFAAWLPFTDAQGDLVPPPAVEAGFVWVATAYLAVFGLLSAMAISRERHVLMVIAGSSLVWCFLLTMQSLVIPAAPFWYRCVRETTPLLIVCMFQGYRPPEFLKTGLCGDTKLDRVVWKLRLVPLTVFLAFAAAVLAYNGSYFVWHYPVAVIFLAAASAGVWRTTQMWRAPAQAQPAVIDDEAQV